jgi:hypothetical protein
VKTGRYRKSRADASHGRLLAVLASGKHPNTISETCSMTISQHPLRVSVHMASPFINKRAFPISEEGAMVFNII